MRLWYLAFFVPFIAFFSLKPHRRPVITSTATSPGYSSKQFLQIEVDGFTVIQNANWVPTRKTIFFLHGFPDNYFSFDHQMVYFSNKGYNVVALSLPGYEPTNVLPSYKLPLVAQKLGDVIQKLPNEMKDDVYLVGHDWSSCLLPILCSELEGTVAVKKMAQIAVPSADLWFYGIIRYPFQILYSYYMILFHFPFASDFLLRTGFLEYLWTGWDFDVKKDDALRIEAVRRTLTTPDGRGGIIAQQAIGYYRALFPMILDRTLLNPVPLKVPTLYLLGMRDGCVHSDFQRAVTRNVSNLVVEEFPDGGHFMHQTHPEEVNAALERWFFD